MNKDQCADKLHRLENFGYLFSSYWQELRNSEEFCKVYPYDTIKGGKDESVEDMRAQLIDYLMLLGMA